MRKIHTSPPPDVVIQSLDPARWTRSYGVLRQAIRPWEGRGEPPFGLAWCRLGPGEASMLHNHHEGEAFYIASGAGELRGVDTCTPIRAGDAIYLPAMASHSLCNTSDREELQFAAIYWSDVTHLRDRIAERALRAAGARRRRSFIIPAFPTPNGDFHLGHLSGPYLAADALARFRRLLGDEVYLVTGTDDHQSYVVTRAWRDDRPPGAVADHFAAILDQTLRTARIELTALVRPHHSALHRETVQRFFRRIHDNGHLVAREVDAAFCDRCDMVLFGGYVEGRCPSCGQASDGSICERCAHPNDCIDLVEPRCTRCATPASRRRLSRLYFPLEPHRARLIEHLETVAMVPRARAACQRLLAHPLPEIAVSHPTGWGIPVPVEGFGDQRIDTWLEVIAGYLAAAEAAAGRSPSGWNDPDTEVIQCSGFDNTFFHGLYFPALLTAYDPDTALPRAVITNEFLLLDGEKLSTSRSHAVWARDLLAASCADAVRMFLAWNRPEGEPTAFSRRGFDAFVAAELVGRWDGWLAALGGRIERLAGFASDGAESWSADHERFWAQLVGAVDRCATAYRPDGFALQDAARAASDLVRIAARFGAATEHMVGIGGTAADDAVRTSLALELTAAKALAVVTAPVMPDFARWLWDGLGLSATPMTWAEATAIFPYGVTGMRIAAYFGPRTTPPGS